MLSYKKKGYLDGIYLILHIEHKEKMVSKRGNHRTGIKDHSNFFESVADRETYKDWTRSRLEKKDEVKNEDEEASDTVTEVDTPTVTEGIPNPPYIVWDSEAGKFIPRDEADDSWGHYSHVCLLIPSK